jgi:tight adherence protein C
MLTLAVARAVLIVVAAISAFFFAYGLASAPARVASRLGMRGLKRREALQSTAGWSALEPFVRWLGTRVSGLLTDEQHKTLDDQIALAGDVLGITAVAIGLTIGLVLPYMQITDAGQTRLQGINEALPYVIDLMGLAMSAGLDFPGAIRQVVEKSTNPKDPIVIELQRILRELSIGRTRKQALTDFSKRCPTMAVTEFVGALVQAEEQGNPVAETLMIQAGVARMRRSVRAEEAAAKAAVRMVGPLFLLFACIMMLVMGPMILALMNAG